MRICLFGCAWLAVAEMAVAEDCPPTPPKTDASGSKLLDADAKNPGGPGGGTAVSTDPAPAGGSPTGGSPTSYTAAGSEYAPNASAAHDAGSDAHSDASGWRSFADRERGLAGSIGQAYSNVSGYAQPRLASPDPQVRNQAQQYLSQPAEAGSHAKEFQNLGLNTNRDVLEHGQEYANNLNDAADRHDKDAKTWDKLGDQADAAAEKMKEFNKTLEQRNNNIQSVKDQSILAANRKGGSAEESTVADGTGSNKNADGSLASAGKLGAIDPLGGKVSAGGKGKDGDREGLGYLYDGAGGRRPAGGLADRLKDALSEANGKGAKSEGDPKSEFDSLFQKGEKTADGKTGKDGKAAGDVGSDGARNGKSGFSLAGSDTDHAIKSLLGGMQGADEDKRVFGDIDQTIFARMKKYLTKAQVDKKVGN